MAAFLVAFIVGVFYGSAGFCMVPVGLVYLVSSTQTKFASKHSVLFVIALLMGFLALFWFVVFPADLLADYSPSMPFAFGSATSDHPILAFPTLLGILIGAVLLALVGMIKRRLAKH